MTATASRAHHGHVGWLEHTLAGISGSVERAVFTESYARAAGWLQRIDPRAKLGMFVVVVLAASLSSSFAVLTGLYLLILGAGRASNLPFDFFVKRVWLGMPFFAGVVILPSIFLAPGPRLFELSIGALHLGPTIPGLVGAAVFVIRVGVCVSLAVLLVLTTPWADLLRSLQALRVPQVFILILSMTYRYIFLFLHSVNGTFEARKSRTVGRPQGAEARRWISQSVAALLNRSFKMSNDVYSAMLARGFTGEVRTYNRYRMVAGDWTALLGAFVVASLVVIAGRFGGVMAKAGPTNGEPIFSLRGVGYRYAGRQRALGEIDLDVHRGEQIALLGANGSGKSTLLKLLDGILAPSEGTMQALGRDVAAVAAGEDAFRFHREVGLVFQDPDVQLFSATVFDDVAFGPLQLGLSSTEVNERCREALEQMEIAHLAHRAPFELSGGEKKRAAIASVLSLHPEVILLDEPTAALDPRTKWVLVNLIRDLGRAGKTIITATHELEIVPIIAERVVIIGEERRVLADGPTDELLHDHDLLIRANLIHEHLHHHGSLVHSHAHDLDHH